MGILNAEFDQNAVRMISKYFILEKKIPKYTTQKIHKYTT